MDTTYQKIFVEITSDEILESIFPTDTNLQLQFKTQIQSLFEKLDGEGIKEKHKDDYKYNIEKNRTLITEILSIDNGLQEKAKENFEKIKYSLLGALISKYDEICRIKNINITNTHSKNSGEKHGENFLEFIKDVFNIEIVNDNNYLVPNIEDRRNLYFFIKSATILKCQHLTFFLKQSDEVISGLTTINVPQTIKIRVDNVLYIKELNCVEPEILEKLEQKFFKIMDLLISKHQENLKKNLAKLDKDIKDLINGNQILSNHYRIHQSEIATKWNLKDTNNQGNIITDDNLSVFLKIIDIDQKQQGKPIYMRFLEQSNINPTIIEKFKNKIDIYSVFAWTNDEATSELLSVYKANKNILVKYKENDKEKTIILSEFLKKHAIFSDRGRPATNFFALIQINFQQNRKNRKIINKLIMSKLRKLNKEIKTLKKCKTSESKQKLEKLLLPFSALFLYKKIDNKDYKIDINGNLNEDKFIKYFDKLVKKFPIIEKEATTILNKYKLLEKSESPEQIENNLKLATKEICGNTIEIDSSSSAASDSISSNNSIIIEEMPLSEDIEDSLQTEYYYTQSELINSASTELTQMLNLSNKSSQKTTCGSILDVFLSSQSNSELSESFGRSSLE